MIVRNNPVSLKPVFSLLPANISFLAFISINNNRKPNYVYFTQFESCKRIPSAHGKFRHATLGCTYASMKPDVEKRLRRSTWSSRFRSSTWHKIDFKCVWCYSIFFFNVTAFRRRTCTRVFTRRNGTVAVEIPLKPTDGLTARSVMTGGLRQAERESVGAFCLAGGAR